jgi:hypothetical protein
MQSKRYRIYVIFVAVAVLLTSSVAPIFAWGGGGPTPDTPSIRSRAIW